MRLLINCLGDTKICNVICRDLFPRFHLGFSTDNLGEVGGEHAERFHQAMSSLIKIYQRKRRAIKFVKIRWTLKKRFQVS